MNRSQQLALQMLDEIDRARSGSLPLEQLEERLWRLLDATGPDFPPSVASRVEDLVLEVRRLQRENLFFGMGGDVDENRGTEVIFHEVTGALHRFLG